MEVVERREREERREQDVNLKTDKAKGGKKREEKEVDKERGRRKEIC